MKLSLFTGEQHTETTQIQATPAQIAKVNRQIRALAPGQTLSGEILSKNGSEVQVKLSEDMVINARVDKNLNIEIGQNMTFEVKNNGKTLTLSPLYTNVSSDINVLKALEMAGIGVNDTSVEMTKQMMTAGLPVNKTVLQQMMREINTFPQAEISDVVNLHKLNMPVNETNVNQMTSYRNLTHQLIGGLEQVLNTLPESMDSMVAEGDFAGAAKIYQELFQLVQEGQSMSVGQTEATAGGNVNMPDNAIKAELPENRTGTAGTVLENQSGINGELQQGTDLNKAVNTVLNDITGSNNQILQEMIQEIGQNVETAGENGSVQGESNGQRGMQTTSSAIPEMVRNTISGDILNLMENLQISEQDGSLIREQILQFAKGTGNIEDLFASLNKLTEMVNENDDITALERMHKVFSGKEFRELLNGQLKNLWTITPDEVSEPGKVDELYQRLNKQLKALSAVLESVNQTDSTAFKAVSNMNQNLDFLNQVNQMYAYVQLPLKLQQGEAHGELYVYTNKKNLAQGDGPISALLHLDMEHLGPVDVYVTMQNTRVNTQFYVQDDEMLDFLESHMDLLTARLQKKGYDCNFTMTSRQGNDSEEGGIQTILRQEKAIALSQYAFDVRT